MNRAFLEDLKRYGFKLDLPNIKDPDFGLQLYIAEKLWELVQYAKNQEQR